MILLNIILSLFELEIQTIALCVSVLNLCATITVASFIYKLNKSSNVNERKMDFYNKVCYDLWEKQPTKATVELKDMKDIMEVAKFIDKHNNICISDGIWEDIEDAVQYIGSGNEFPFEDDFNQELKKEAYDKAEEYVSTIRMIFCEMREKYEKKFYN